MLKFGVVEQVLPGKVKVKFTDQDAMLSFWLPVLKRKTLKDKHFHGLDVGEHVACLMDENLEDGVVLGAIYSDAEPPPVTSLDKDHITYEDGTVLEYDRKTHELVADVKGKVTLTATGDVKVTAPTHTIEADVSITGNVSVQGNINASGSIIDAGGNTPNHAH